MAIQQTFIGPTQSVIMLPTASMSNSYLTATKSYVDDSIHTDGTISAGSLKINGIDVGKMLNEISERLLILEPRKDLLEKYVALQDLYKQYKMMEALLIEDAKKNGI